jgi:hypothetical protein
MKFIRYLKGFKKGFKKDLKGILKEKIFISFQFFILF